MKQTNIAVLLGGNSAEREVSFLVGGSSIARIMETWGWIPSPVRSNLNISVA